MVTPLVCQNLLLAKKNDFIKNKICGSYYKFNCPNKFIKRYASFVFNVCPSLCNTFYCKIKRNLVNNETASSEINTSESLIFISDCK